MDPPATEWIPFPFRPFIIIKIIICACKDRCVAVLLLCCSHFPPGCCPAHSPLLPRGVPLPPLAPELHALLQPLLRLLLLQVLVTMEGERTPLCLLVFLHVKPLPAARAVPGLKPSTGILKSLCFP